MSKLVVKRLIVIFLTPIAIWGIMWCCIKAIEPFSTPSGLCERETVECSPYLIGKKVQIPLEHFEIGCGPSKNYHFGTDAGSDELVALIRQQSHVADVLDLGRWNDGSRRYLITMEAADGVTYLELIDFQESVDMEGKWNRHFRSEHRYALFDCSVDVEKNEEYYSILFPQIRRHESGEDILSGAVLEAERSCEIQKTENLSGESLFEFFLQFYEDAALYRVLEHTDSEITVVFNRKALENNPSTVPKQDTSLETAYKGMFKISIDEAEQTASITILN